MASGDDRNWDLLRLRIFDAVVRQGSLTRAGAMLGLPQPTISRQIAKLEAECGGRLFHRTGRGVRLSELGERVLPRVQGILDTARELADEVSELAQSPAGEVRIGALPSLYLSLIVPLYFHLRQHAPRIRLRVFEGSAGQIDQWLAQGYVDIGLPYRYGKDIGQAAPLVRVDSFLMGPPDNPFAREKSVSFRALHQLPLVLPGGPSSVRVLLERLARKCGIQLNVVIEADSTQIQKALARMGGAFTVLPLHAASEELEQRSLAASRIVDPEIERAIVLDLTSASPPSRAARETVKVIRKLMARWRPGR